MGLVPRPHLAWAAMSIRPAPSRSVRISLPNSPMLFPAPVISMAKVPWRETERAYSRTGTVVNRLTAKKPLSALRAGCWRLPRPDAYSMPHSKADTTTLTAKRAQPNWEKKRTTDRTQERSNSSTPMFPIWAKKAPRKPTIWL